MAKAQIKMRNLLPGDLLVLDRLSILVMDVKLRKLKSKTKSRWPKRGHLALRLLFLLPNKTVLHHAVSTKEKTVKDWVDGRSYSGPVTFVRDGRSTCLRV